MKVVGIDPGLKGGIAVLSDNTESVGPMPILDGVVDMGAVARWVEGASLVIIEALGMRPGQAGVATLVRNWQRVEDACVWTKAPYQIVQPKTWQKGIVPAGLPAANRRKQTIDAYCRYARAKWPFSFTRKATHDGIAAALCMAEWGSKQLTAPT